MSIITGCSISDPVAAPVKLRQSVREFQVDRSVQTNAQIDMQSRLSMEDHGHLFNVYPRGYGTPGPLKVRDPL